MRELTSEERELLDRRNEGLDTFVQEAYEDLVDFIEGVELPQPHLVLREAERYLAPLDAWLRLQPVAPEDRLWLIARVGLFIGELLNQRLRGHWIVEPDPDSPHYAQFVVGNFQALANPYARTSPFAWAAWYVDQPPGRSLSELVERAERGLSDL